VRGVLGRVASLRLSPCITLSPMPLPSEDRGAGVSFGLLPPVGESVTKD